MLIRFLAVVGAVNRETPIAVALPIISVLSPSGLRLGTSRETQAYSIVCLIMSDMVMLVRLAVTVWLTRVVVS